MALPSIKAGGRLGITVADGVDADDEPEITWCDEGEVWLTPTLTYTQTLGETGSPALGNSVIKLVVDPEGWLTHNGLRYAKVFDLTSEQFNPHVAANKATHNVTFKAVKCNGVEVRFPDGPARLAADTVDPVTGEVNILKQMPIPTAGGVPIVVGPAGPGITSLAVVGDTLVATMQGGAELSTVLPSAMVDSDAFVADRIDADASLTKVALRAGFAEITGPTGAALPPGTHVQIRLTSDFTDIDDIVVVED